MEGPSLVIATEEFRPFLKKKISRAVGSAKLPFEKLTRLTRTRSWGKHLLLSFPTLTLRIHFLMFGSYRINHPRENRIPKLEFEIGADRIYFYSCAIKELTTVDEKAYDWTVDLMSKKWDAAQALRSLRAKPAAQVCDVLMDQAIFSGLGNIMKNEILFNLLMHPETRVDGLTTKRARALVTESEKYAWQFYDWKKANVLKRNWKIMRKKICPRCGGKVKKKPTGKLQRLSHFCPVCQERA